MSNSTNTDTALARLAKLREWYFAARSEAESYRDRLDYIRLNLRNLYANVNTPSVDNPGPVSVTIVGTPNGPKRVRRLIGNRGVASYEVYDHQPDPNSKADYLPDGTVLVTGHNGQITDERPRLLQDGKEIVATHQQIASLQERQYTAGSRAATLRDKIEEAKAALRDRGIRVKDDLLGPGKASPTQPDHSPGRQVPQPSSLDSQDRRAAHSNRVVPRR